MTSRIALWRFQPHPVAALYQSTYLIRRSLFKALRPIAASVTGQVLDFGCGSKPYRSLFTACESYIGLDIEVSGHDHADSDVDVFYDGEKIPFEDETFDAVVAFEVFEHVFNIDTVLREIITKLRPGGRFIISIPFAWPEHEQPYDFARYTSFGIESVLRQAGFTDIKITKTAGFFASISQLLLHYLVANIFNRLGVVGKVLRIPFCALINLTAMAGEAILPRDDSYFANLVVQARKPGA